MIPTLRSLAVAALLVGCAAAPRSTCMVDPTQLQVERKHTFPVDYTFAHNQHSLHGFKVGVKEVWEFTPHNPYDERENKRLKQNGPLRLSVEGSFRGLFSEHYNTYDVGVPISGGLNLVDDFSLELLIDPVRTGIDSRNEPQYTPQFGAGIDYKRLHLQAGLQAAIPIKNSTERTVGLFVNGGFTF